MTKKALVHTVDYRGEDERGYRVLEVVDANQTFEVHSSFLWIDCNDTVETDLDWYDPVTKSFRPLPAKIHPDTAGDLAKNDEGLFIEDYEWDYKTDSWKKIQLLD